MNVRLTLRRRGVSSEPYRRRNSPRPAAWVLSCLIHGLFIGFVLLVDPPSAIRRSVPTLYEQVIEPNEKKIIWYRPKELPTIDPVRQIGDEPLPQADELRKDVIISIAPDAPKDSHQLVYQPDREKPLMKETAAPNMVAVKGQAHAPRTTKPFSPPPRSAQRQPVVATLPEPAKIQSAPLAPPPDAMIGTLPKLRRAFVAPPTVPTTAKVRTDLPVLLAPQLDAPAGAAGGLASNSPSDSISKSLTKLPSRPFVAPGRGSQAGPRSELSLQEPNISLGGEVNAAVLSAAPGTELFTKLPDGVRPADISAAPRVGPRSTGSAGRDGSAIPGVVLQPGVTPPPHQPVRAGMPAPVYEETRVVAGRRTLSAPLRPSSRSIPAAIEARFHGRVVYTMVIPMPRLPIYGGDWIMWFAERDPAAGASTQMRAPLPLRKYALLSDEPTPTSGRVKLSATILKNGQPDSVDLLDKGNTPPEAAVGDMKEWEFSPALKDGEPVEVEIILEIPYH